MEEKSVNDLTSIFFYKKEVRIINQKFDILGRYKYPKLKLCTPDRVGQGYLSSAYNLKIKKNFNSVYELSFQIDWTLGGKENPLYGKILGGKLIFADQFGYFTITDAPITGNGIMEKKTVQAVSAEFEIAKTKLNRIEGTIKLFNPMDGYDTSTLIGMFLKSNPKWSVGTIDKALWNIYRTFDVQTSDWYNFLIKDVEEKYMCIFKFDNVNRQISCYSPENSTIPTGIFVSYNNLIDNIEIEEKFSEVFTSLNCTGANYLDIRGVNPTGGNLIYNFKYYKNEDWLPKNLIDKITAWETKISENQIGYKNILTTIRERQVELTGAQTSLVEIESKLKACEQALALHIAGNINNANRYNILAEEKRKHLSDIEAKKLEIISINEKLNAAKVTAKGITDLLSFDNNFTKDEISKLQDIIITDNYQNNAFAKTDIMTQYEIQDLSLDLYNTAVKILDRISEPRYYFKASLVNFIFLKEYEKFTQQADVGSVITVEIKKGFRTKVVLLSLELDFDNPTSFNMEFSNRYRLDSGAFQFGDLFVDNSRTSASYDWDKAIIGEPIKGGKFTEVTEFINGNFNAAKNALLSAKDVGVVIDGSGIHLRRYVENKLQPFEVWITDGKIAMSRDNFNTPPQIAIGEFLLPNGKTFAGGVNAEFLAGHLLVGNQLIIEAENKSYIFDGNGAKFFNATLEIIDGSNIKRILLDPDNGFKIQGRENPNRPWEDRIYLDNLGNAVFKGIIESTEGKIGGLRITQDGIFNDNNGDYWRSDGTGQFGLMSYNNSSATFKGNIYAMNLKASDTLGWVGNQHIKDNSISGAKLEASYRDSLAQSLAKVEIKADRNSADIINITNWQNSTTRSIASIEQRVNSNSSSISANARYIDSVNDYAARIELKADKNGSSISLVANNVSVVSNNFSVLNGTVSALSGSFNSLSSTVAHINNAYMSRVDVSEFLSGNSGSISYLFAKEIGAQRIYMGGNLVSVNGHSHNGYASASHSHSGYASAYHSHDTYAQRSHQHSITINGKTYKTN